MFKSQISKDDSDLIFKFSEYSLQKLSNKKIFISGATGFFGKWLVQTLTLANLKMNLNLELHLLSRDWGPFLKKYPHFIDTQFAFLHTGDIKDFKFPEPCEIIIHAANDARPDNSVSSIDDFNKTVDLGSQRLLSYAKFSQAKKILLTSSGAIYGNKAPYLKKFTEDTDSDPFDFYGIAKLKQEKIFSDYYTQNVSTDILIARCFAFVGPYLPLDKGYAIGNFIHSSLQNKAIQISGDGTSLRSYLYSADLMIWLVNLLIKCQKLQYFNVGSDQSISIKELAEKVSAQSLAPLEIHYATISKNSPSATQYVPNILKAQQELNLKVYTPIEMAIKKTLNWHKDRIG